MTRTLRKWLSLFLAVSLALSGPVPLVAQQTAASARALPHGVPVTPFDLPPADPPVSVLQAEPGSDPEVSEPLRKRLHQKIFHSLKRILEGLTARITRAESVDLNLVSMSMDDRHRIFIELDGLVELKFEKPHPRVDAKMQDLRGRRMETNGPFNLDFVIDVVERTSETDYHVEFEAKVIIVSEEFLSKLVRFGASVIGTVTLMGIGNDLAAFLDGIDAEIVAVSLEKGMRDLTKVVMSIAGVEGYDAWRGLRHDRIENDQGSHAGAVLAHLGRSLLKGASGVAMNVVGMSIGAAIGASLVPAGGATIGAILGAAGLVLVGNIVFTKLTLDLPMFYRLKRISRLHRKIARTEDPDRIDRFSQKIQKYETKILKRISLEMRTDKFRCFDELRDQIGKYEPKEREAFLSLIKKIQAKLRYQVLNHQDGLAARKLRQLEDTLQSVGSPAAED